MCGSCRANVAPACNLITACLQASFLFLDLSFCVQLRRDPRTKYINFALREYQSSCERRIFREAPRKRSARLLKGGYASPPCPVDFGESPVQITRKITGLTSAGSGNDRRERERDAARFSSVKVQWLTSEMRELNWGRFSRRSFVGVHCGSESDWIRRIPRARATWAPGWPATYEGKPFISKCPERIPSLMFTRRRRNSVSLCVSVIEGEAFVHICACACTV